MLNNFMCNKISLINKYLSFSGNQEKGPAIGTRVLTIATVILAIATRVLTNATGLTATVLPHEGNI